MKDLCTTSAEPLPLTLNRDFKMVDGDWIQLARTGEVRAPLEGAGKPVEVVQVLDASAFDAIVNRFRSDAARANFPGLLVDFDHFSHDPEKESRAAAWLTDLAHRPEGLFGKARFTTTGRSAIEGGDYRLVSPVFAFARRTYTTGEKVRPVGLQSAGLTNDPRIKGMIPISNRNGANADAGNNQPEPTMKDINKTLGLAEDAPEASALAALQLISNRATSAETERDALKKERDTLLSAQVEADLNAAGLKGEARTKWQAALVANRASALELLAALGKDDSGYAVTHNRSKKPAADGAAKPEETEEARQLSAVSDYKAKNRCTFQEAWEATRIEKPELFAEKSAE